MNSLLDGATLRGDFPVLQQNVNGKPIAFLDSAASSQRPQTVIDCLSYYASHYHSNVHRGVYQFSEQATAAYENARAKVARFIGATDPAEVVFVRNATEAVNLVAWAWGWHNLHAGDHILLSVMEHHSNIVPWQLIAQRTGAVLDYLPIDGDGRLVLDELDRLLTEQTKMVALTQQSNVLGTINPVTAIAERAHAVGALMLVDGAQSVPHMPINVQTLGADFLVFSGHKMCGPTGIGVLWGRKALLDSMPPFMGGGSMITQVHLDHSDYAEVPNRFEAGTPAIGEAIALGAAVEYLAGVGLASIHAYEHYLTDYALTSLQQMPGVRLFGPPTADERGGAIAFTLDGVHPHDIAAVLDEEGIAVRAGHHCAQPLHHVLEVPATARASFYLYNATDEIDRLTAGIRRVQGMFGA